MTLDFLPEVTFVFMLIFARVGAMLMLLPALGESSIPPRFRLSLGLALALVLYPAVSQRYAGLPGTVTGLAAAFALELLIGLAVGFTARLVVTALQVAGSTIAMQLGLSFAEGIDPTQQQHSAILGSFLTVTGITVIFAANLHHLALAGMVDSYKLFPPGLAPPAGDLAMMAIRMIGESFRVAVQIAAPFLVFGLVFQLGLGLLSRLMPQLQVFFIAMPASIIVGILLIGLLVATMLMWWSSHVETALGRLVAS